MKDGASAEERLATLDTDLDNVYQGESRADAANRSAAATADSGWASLKPSRGVSLDQEGLDFGATLTQREDAGRASDRATDARDRRPAPTG